MQVKKSVDLVSFSNSKGKKLWFVAFILIFIFWKRTDLMYLFFHQQLDCGIHPGLTGMDALPFVDLIEAHDIDLLLISQ